mgnify:CR=1 FL=1
MKERRRKQGAISERSSVNFFHFQNQVSSSGFSASRIDYLSQVSNSGKNIISKKEKEVCRCRSLSFDILTISFDISNDICLRFVILHSKPYWDIQQYYYDSHDTWPDAVGHIVPIE